MTIHLTTKRLSRRRHALLSQLRPALRHRQFSSYSDLLDPRLRALGSGARNVVGQNVHHSIATKFKIRREPPPASMLALYACRANPTTNAKVTDVMRYGFIGLGEQGGAMAKMMLRAGLPLTVWTRRPEASEPFSDEGARISKSAAALAAESDLLSICVTSSTDVLEVVHDRGVLHAMRPNTVLAIHSTILPSVSIEIEKQATQTQVEVLDAPVSGSARAAFNKTLLVMVGGSASALDRARAAFSTYGDPIVHVGCCGMAMQTKLLTNLLAAANKGIAIRILCGASIMGLDPNSVQRLALAGVGRSTALEIVARLQDSQRARHIGPLVAKDIQLAREALPIPELNPLFSLAQEAIEWITKWGEGNEKILLPP
jgi:3-hydroxyisobutyrate dehydrogenase